MTLGTPIYHAIDWFTEEFSYKDFLTCTYNKRLSKISTLDIYNDHQILSTKQFVYENPEHINPTLIIENSSDGKRIKTHLKYPPDYLSFSNNCRVEYENILDSCKSIYNEWTTELAECMLIYGQCYEGSLNCISLSEECYHKEWNGIPIGHFQQAFGYLFSKCKHYENCIGDFSAELISSGYYDCLDTNNYMACQVDANFHYNNCLIDYYYSVNELYESATDPFLKGVYLLAANGFHNKLIEKTIYLDDQEIEHYKFNYFEFDTTHLPVLERTEQEINGGGLTPEITFRYNKFLNVIQATPHGKGSSTAYIYGYNNRYPVIVAENLIIEDLESALYETNDSLEYLLNRAGNLKTEQQKSEWAHFNSTLRSNNRLKNSLLTTYTYIPLIGISSKTEPNGLTTYYEYDNFGRLSDIRDNDSKIVQHFSYNYQQDQIELDPASLSFPYSGGSGSIDITSNKEWSIEEEIPWLSVSNNSGIYNDEITISCLVNNDTTSRAAKITVICGNTNEYFSVTQNGSPYLIVSPDTVFFSSAGDKIDITVSSNINWTAGVVERESWLSVTNITQTSFTINCGQNEGEDRDGLVWVAGEGLLVHIYVKQWHI